MNKAYIIVSLTGLLKEGVQCVYRGISRRRVASVCGNSAWRPSTPSFLFTSIHHHTGWTTNILRLSISINMGTYICFLLYHEAGEYQPPTPLSMAFRRLLQWQHQCFPVHYGLVKRFFDLMKCHGPSSFHVMLLEEVQVPRQIQLVNVQIIQLVYTSYQPTIT